MYLSFTSLADINQSFINYLYPYFYSLSIEVIHGLRLEILPPEQYHPRILIVWRTQKRYNPTYLVVDAATKVISTQKIFRLKDVIFTILLFIVINSKFSITNAIQTNIQKYLISLEKPNRKPFPQANHKKC